MLGGQALLVDAVAGLVKNTEERFVEVPRIVARRDATIAGADAAAKWMRRHIEPAGVEVEADGGRGRLPKLLLLLDRIIAFEKVAGRTPAGCRDRGYQRDKVGTQRGGSRGDFARRGT